MLRRGCLRLAPAQLPVSSITQRMREEKLFEWKAETPGAGRSTLSKKFVFRDFHAAWGFMSGCVPYINAVDHHPEWFNVYNRVEVTLSTHDCGGISEKDIALAVEMERVANVCAK